jgi:hypothetical protein
VATNHTYSKKKIPFCHQQSGIFLPYDQIGHDDLGARSNQKSADGTDKLACLVERGGMFLPG